MAYNINGGIPCGTDTCTGSEHRPASACNSVYDIILNAIKEIKGDVANLDGIAKEATLLAKVAELKEAINSIDFTTIEQAIQDVEDVTAREATLIQGVGDIIKAVENIDFTDLENSIAEVKEAVNNIDLSPVESKVDEGVKTLSSKIDNIKLPEVDLSNVAKQESVNIIAQAAEAYNTGKNELAQNITAKGVPASPTETLPELAAKVAQIAQTETILDGGEVMAAQQFGDGALWNLYQVLADMKTRFMGTGDYAALIICEYYKGYDSLTLQGADGYYTCDGDYYDYTSPTHVWHDADNGKTNRWVAFLYRNEGARLNITETAISPRKMYIGGHIGTIEYFVNGQLTELVCGVEETDMVDNFAQRGFTQEWRDNLTLRNVRNMGGVVSSAKGLFTLDTGVDDATLNTEQGKFVSLNSANAVIIKGVGEVKFGNTQGVFIECNKNTDVLTVKCDAKKITSFTTYGQGPGIYFYGGLYKVEKIDFGKLEELNYVSSLFVLYSSTAPNLIDIIVGSMTTKLDIKGWNPTNVLADTAKTLTLVTNIRDHIANRVSDRTGLSGLTFTISSNMKNTLDGYSTESADETEAAIATIWEEAKSIFVEKNWSVAGA